MIGKAYRTLDDALMKGVNKGVRAWNWTTGRTKADLANACLIINSAAFEDAAAIYIMGRNSISLGLLGSAVPLTNITYFRDNVKIDRLEAKALEQNALNYEVEQHKKQAAFFGPLMLSLSAGGAIFSDSTLMNLLSFGCSASGASWYVMRADYLPPRKNCLARGLDKLKESLKQYAPQPAPIRVQASTTDKLLPEGQ